MTKMKRMVLQVFATTYFQPFYKMLHYIALKGMNYGSANSPLDSGELSVLRLLKKELPDHPVIFDVGANNGQYLEFIETYFKELQPIVHVFEPDKAAFKKLERRFSNKPHIILNNIALGDTNQIATLYSSGIGGVDGSLINSETKNQEQSSVSVMTLDDYCIKNEIDTIHFLKVDVEGFEMKVLKGAIKKIEKLQIERIQLEHGSLHSIIAGTTLYGFTNLLKKYECYHIKQNGIYKIHYAPINEIFYNSNYYFKISE